VKKVTGNMAVQSSCAAIQRSFFGFARISRGAVLHKNLSRRIAIALTCVGLACCNDTDHKRKKTEMHNLQTKQK